MNQQIILLLSFTTLCSVAFAQEKNTNASKANVTQNPDKVLEQKIDSILTYVNDQTPGGAVIVTQHGKIIANKLYCLASITLSIGVLTNRNKKEALLRRKGQPSSPHIGVLIVINESCIFKYCFFMDDHPFVYKTGTILLYQKSI